MLSNLIQHGIAHAHKQTLEGWKKRKNEAKEEQKMSTFFFSSAFLILFSFHFISMFHKFMY